MTSHVTFFQLNSTCGVKSIKHFFEVFLNCNFAECQISVVLLRDPLRDFFCSYWASPPINLVELLALDWLFTILKTLNPTSQPSRSEKKS